MSRPESTISVISKGNKNGREREIRDAFPNTKPASIPELKDLTSKELSPFGLDIMMPIGTRAKRVTASEERFSPTGMTVDDQGTND